VRESSTYQQILADGEALGVVKGERDALIRIGSRRLGAPDDSIRGILERASLTRLEAWLDRLTEVESWQELLAS
jgi:hypothetical protein